MSFFTNKHVVIALLVAPVLAVISYVVVDRIVSPEAITAKTGESFPMVTRSNCRYASGKCGLVNGDFEVNLALQAYDNNQVQTYLFVTSEFPLDGIRYKLVDNNGKPLTEGVANANTIAIPVDAIAQAHALQIAIKSSGVLYFSEAETEFLKKTDAP